MKNLTWVGEVIKIPGTGEEKMGQDKQLEVWNKLYQNYEL